VISALRVLLVEDSDSDAKLITAALRRGCPGVEVERVDDGIAMRSALESKAWDAVVSDWTLPAFSGLAALRLVRELGLDLPFIIVSGSIGEEAAVEGMRQGAHDYVLKDRLTRLAIAVEREVAEARMRAELRDQRRRTQEQEERAREELERRVALRTEELRVANERLAAELVERRRAEEAADAANRAKSTFLANMSHEIRTPMNSILGYTQLMGRDPQLQPNQRQHLEIIARSGGHLLHLVNDVLEMSKIEAGHCKLARADVDLRELVLDVERMFRLRADAGALSFEVQISPEVPRCVVTDQGKLRQVLVNLLGNAIKFTHEGGVTVRLGVRSAGGAARLSVEVEDTGPGLSAEEMQELFKPFVQTRVGVQAHGGTGLGLALSREFVRVMGGDITVESRVAAGSVFRFDIPLEIGSQPSDARPLATAEGVVGIVAQDRAPRILIADDDEDGRSWLTQLLQQLGFEVREVGDGLEAVACAKQWRPDLVLMDMNMPVMDGYAATRTIRASSEIRDTVIVALTAAAFDDARSGILEAGADGCLLKPCQEAELLEEIRRLLEIEYQYAPEPPRPVSPPSSGRARPLSPEARLPATLAARLRSAAHVADYDRLNELIDEIPPECKGVTAELRRLTDRFAYEEIESVVDKQTDRRRP
jgi:signal transduction histidine kinase